MNRIITTVSLVLVCAFLAGCSTPHPYTIRPGGYLNANDYTELQKAADKVPPFDCSKDWPNPSPFWSYYVNTTEDFSAFDQVAIPDLQVSVEGDKTLAKSIPDQLAKDLVAKKMFKAVDRSGNGGPLAFVGAITYYQPGSLLVGTLANMNSPGGAKALVRSLKYVQVEFKIMANGNQVGAIQAYATRAQSISLLGLVANAVRGGIDNQISSGVFKSVNGIKDHIPSQAQKDDVAFPDM